MLRGVAAAVARLGFVAERLGAGLAHGCHCCHRAGEGVSPSPRPRVTSGTPSSHRRLVVSVAAMPGRTKASPVSGQDQPQDLEGSRGAKAGAVQEEPPGEGGGDASAGGCSPNFGDAEIVKSPSDPKQYR